MYIFKWFRILVVSMVLFFLQTCNQNQQSAQVKEEIFPGVDLKHLKLKGTIRVITDYNSTNYFIYKGRPMGFQYELLQHLSRHLNVKIELMVNNDITKAYKALEKGECDLLAMSLAVTNDRVKRFNYTVPHSQSRQMLVQRDISYTQIDTTLNEKASLIRNQLDLAGKTVYVPKESSFEKRLLNLSNEIGDTIYVVALENFEQEQLIGQVAKGEIDYTVADENVALVNQSYYPNLDVKTAISFPQKLAWALRKESKTLLQSINSWMTEFRRSDEYKRIYKKYYKSHRLTRMVQSEYYTLKSGKISAFDEIIKNQAKAIDWDWRLLASLIYQESNFDPNAVSWAGAFGLMQLMPETGYLYNVDTFSTPVENIKAGVKHIRYLDRKLDETLHDPTDKLQFMLASYNVGLGHILDARRLAIKNGKNPDRWSENVDYYLLNKSKPEFYNDPVVRYGYCRGAEPFNYVTEILERYKHYKNIVMN